MAKVIETLIKIKSRIADLLVEIFPNCKEEIEFACKDDFKEWFGMLFKLNEWQMRPGMIAIDKDSLVMSSTLLNKAREENKNNGNDIEDYGFISVVIIDGEFHLIDGYHRVLIAQEKGIISLRGIIWEKKPNSHVNCSKIKKLIIDEL